MLQKLVPRYLLNRCIWKSHSVNQTFDVKAYSFLHTLKWGSGVLQHNMVWPFLVPNPLILAEWGGFNLTNTVRRIKEALIFCIRTVYPHKNGTVCTFKQNVRTLKYAKKEKIKSVDVLKFLNHLQGISVFFDILSHLLVQVRLRHGSHQDLPPSCQS